VVLQIPVLHSEPVTGVSASRPTSLEPVLEQCGDIDIDSLIAQVIFQTS